MAQPRIIKLDESHEELIKEFCYKRERENIFVIGSFKSYPNTFDNIEFYGCLKGDKIVGLSAYFENYKSFVVNSDQANITKRLIYHVLLERPTIEIECVPAFKKDGDVIVNQLKKYNILPKKITEEQVMVMSKNEFSSFCEGDEQQATWKDMDEVITLHRGLVKDEGAITDKERSKFNMLYEFILRVDGNIVAKANIHGYSKSYFQIGGVITAPAYRNRGYSKRVVSKLCEHFFDNGQEIALLFTDKENKEAQSVYNALGFKVVDDYIIAEY